jgi:hypothetical protein
MVCERVGAFERSRELGVWGRAGQPHRKRLGRKREGNLGWREVWKVWRMGNWGRKEKGRMETQIFVDCSGKTVGRMAMDRNWVILVGNEKIGGRLVRIDLKRFLCGSDDG